PGAPRRRVPSSLKRAAKFCPCPAGAGMLPPMQTTRRRFLGGLGATALGLLAAACSAPAATPTQAPTVPPATRAAQVAAPTASGRAAGATPGAQPAGALTALVTNSELVVGRNRFTMALLDPQNQPVTDATVTLEFFQVKGSQATKQGETPATFRWVDQPGKGVYVAQASFPQAGDWGLQATVNEWGLQSEPWVFLVGKDGKIADRFEGATTLDELEAGLKPLL